MKKRPLTVKLDEPDARQLATISAQHGLSQGELVHRSIRSHLGIVPPGVALAAALAEAPRPNADAPWLNGQGGADHG
jgi:hypothetical protein